MELSTTEDTTVLFVFNEGVKSNLKLEWLVTYLSSSALISESSMLCSFGR